MFDLQVHYFYHAHTYMFTDVNSLMYAHVQLLYCYYTVLCTVFKFVVKASTVHGVEIVSSYNDAMTVW